MKFCQACKVSTTDDTVACVACGESCWSVQTADERTDDGSGEPESTEPPKPPMPRRRR